MAIDRASAPFFPSRFSPLTPSSLFSFPISLYLSRGHRPHFYPSDFEFFSFPPFSTLRYFLYPPFPLALQRSPCKGRAFWLSHEWTDARTDEAVYKRTRAGTAARSGIHGTCGIACHAAATWKCQNNGRRKLRHLYMRWMCGIERATRDAAATGWYRAGQLGLSSLTVVVIIMLYSAVVQRSLYRLLKQMFGGTVSMPRKVKVKYPQQCLRSVHAVPRKNWDNLRHRPVASFCIRKSLFARLNNIQYRKKEENLSNLTMNNASNIYNTWKKYNQVQHE